MVPEIKIVRFEPYPNGEPKGYVVGFGVNVGEHSFYRDVIVKFIENENRSESDIIKAAYVEIRESINQEITYFESKSSSLGKNIEDLIDMKSLDEPLGN